MLLRCDFDHAKRRAYLFADRAQFAKKKIVLTRRSTGLAHRVDVVAFVSHPPTFVPLRSLPIENHHITADIRTNPNLKGQTPGVGRDDRPPARRSTRAMACGRW
jgi:hypothetical protein